jgi:hypothetical protein
MITPLITQKQLTNLLTLIDALGISSRYAWTRTRPDLSIHDNNKAPQPTH